MVDIDILATHDQKIKEFEEAEAQVPKYRQQLDELLKTRNSPNLKSHLIVELDKNIAELTQKIEAIESKRDYNLYVSATVEILAKYREVLNTPMKLSFFGKTPKTNPEKEKLIHAYLNAVNMKNYIKVNNSIQQSCENCESKNLSQSEEFVVCVDCGAQKEILFTSSHRDSGRVNVVQKYTYDRKVHFRDCINQYQGKQNCTIDPKVYSDLEEMLESHHLLIGDKTTPQEIRYSKVTRDHILMFLKELKYSKHYENVILIHFNLTGKKPDDISHLEESLLRDFDILVEAYDKHFRSSVSRVNFISTQYVLYQLLLKYKHPCKKEDFMILKTIDRKSFHDNIAQELFSILGWNHSPILG